MCPRAPMALAPFLESAHVVFFCKEWEPLASRHFAPLGGVRFCPKPSAKPPIVPANESRCCMMEDFKDLPGDGNSPLMRPSNRRRAKAAPIPWESTQSLEIMRASWFSNRRSARPIPSVDGCGRRILLLRRAAPGPTLPLPSLNFKDDPHNTLSTENKFRKNGMETLPGAQIGKGFRIHSCACQQRSGLKLSSEFVGHRAVHGSPISH